MKVTQLFHPLVWIILGGTIFTRIASFMAMPFLAIYLHNEIGASPLQIGLTIGIAPLISTFGGFFGGYLTDRFGRKSVILLTILIWKLVFFGFAIAHVIWIFIILNALNGLCRSFFEPSTQALMIDLNEKDFFHYVIQRLILLLLLARLSVFTLQVYLVQAYLLY